LPPGTNALTLRWPPHLSTRHSIARLRQARPRFLAASSEGKIAARMSFEAPQALLLAIPLALLVLTLGRIAPPASYLRWALVPILALALARPVLDRGGDAMDVVVVVDRSRSMPQGSDASAEEILGMLEGKRLAGQRVGVVSFGREARVERAPSGDGRFSSFARPVGGEASDLASALLAAEQLLPESRAPTRQIVGPASLTKAPGSLGAAAALPSPW
jgi:hypothetical protein